MRRTKGKSGVSLKPTRLHKVLVVTQQRCGASFFSEQYLLGKCTLLVRGRFYTKKRNLLEKAGELAGMSRVIFVSSQDVSSLVAVSCPVAVGLEAVLIHSGCFGLI